MYEICVRRGLDMTHENQREDALKDLQKTSASHAEIRHLVREPCQEGLEVLRIRTHVSLHTLVTQPRKKGEGEEEDERVCRELITHSASGRRTPQTRVQPWSTCTAERASLDWTCSSESRCPAPLGFLSGCRWVERAGLRRDAQRVR